MELISLLGKRLALFGFAVAIPILALVGSVHLIQAEMRAKQPTFFAPSSAKLEQAQLQTHAIQAVIVGTTPTLVTIPQQTETTGIAYFKAHGMMH